MKKQRYDFSPPATAAYQYPVQSTAIFGLSFFFFFPYQPISFFQLKHIDIRSIQSELAQFSANRHVSEPNWCESEQIRKRKKKKTTTTTTTNWMQFDAQVAASLARRRVGHECGGHFAASLHLSQWLELRTWNRARWDQSWVKKPCLQEHKQWHLPTLPLEPWKQIMDLLQLSISIHSKTNPISQIP